MEKFQPQVYIHTNILQMPLSMRQFSKEFVKKLIIPSPTKLQRDIVLDNLLAIEMVKIGKSSKFIKNPII
jgi:hypothetical protein